MWEKSFPTLKLLFKELSHDPSFFSPLQSRKAKFTSEFISKAQALSIQQNPLQVHIRRINVLTVETVKTVETVETVVLFRL